MKLVEIKRNLRERLARWLIQPSKQYRPDPFGDFEALKKTIRPGDVLLVEGDTRVARMIQVLTRSNWSHAAIYIGGWAINHPDERVRAFASGFDDEADNLLLEADIETGVALVPLSHYRTNPVRLCRPVGLNDEGCQTLLEYCVQRMCEPYDTSQLLDLVRYLLPLAKLPVRLAQRLWMVGTGETSRTICSTMLGEAFQAVNYPVLPEIPDACADRELCYRLRNARLFVPADFDRSPFFRIIKYQGLDHPRFEKEAFRPGLINWA
jgi:hypothetical protein